ncbi:MAG TPA: hypothetical protein VEI01_07360 [Terriglobales bacterium]|nr:hypothetical protein [Terriglobales bacterium]
MSRTSHCLLIALAATGLSFLALAYGGTWGPCGPSSIIGAFGLLGLLLSLMFVTVLAVGRVVRVIAQLLGSHSSSSVPPVR